VIRALGALLIALLAASCTPGHFKASDDAFAVLTKDGVGVCSAFAISKHELMTAEHCVRDADADFAVVSKELWDRTSKGSAAVTVVSRDTERDLAVLYTPYAFRDFLRFRAPVTGETVNAVSALYDWRHSPGRVLPGFGFFRDTDVTIQHGWSGSPVIGVDGRAVGVVARCNGAYSDGRHVCARNDMQFSVLP
jgi:S1-C subfamily serine protease